jgi:hypothetical protein
MNVVKTSSAVNLAKNEKIIADNIEDSRRE